jgi:hypothetical protein
MKIKGGVVRRLGLLMCPMTANGPVRVSVIVRVRVIVRGARESAVS